MTENVSKNDYEYKALKEAARLLTLGIDEQVSDGESVKHTTIVALGYLNGILKPEDRQTPDNMSAVEIESVTSIADMIADIK